MLGRALEAVALVLALLAALASSGVVRYDQSQTGDYNVHLDLKNVNFFGFLDDSSASFGEYDYDYGEMTLKPPASTANATDNWTISETPAGSSTEKVESNSTTDNSQSDDEGSLTSSTTNKPARRCGAGFYRDPAGRCRRQRRPIKLAGLLNQARNKLTGS